MQMCIIGCGEIGRTLVERYTSRGNDVIVIEQDPKKLEHVIDYSPLTICGMPIDRGVLESADIGSCDVVLCVSDNENLNIMAGQMAKHIFDVPVVFVRTFLPMNTPIYEEMGLIPLCITQMFVNRIEQAIEGMLA